MEGTPWASSLREEVASGERGPPGRGLVGRRLEAGLEAVKPKKEAEDMILGKTCVQTQARGGYTFIPISQVRKLRPQKLGKYGGLVSPALQPQSLCSTLSRGKPGRGRGHTGWGHRGDLLDEGVVLARPAREALLTTPSWRRKCEPLSPAGVWKR